MIAIPVHRIKHLVEVNNTVGSHPPLGLNSRSGGCQPSVKDNYVATLQKAMDTLSNLMDSFHPEMQYKAAMAMLDFEKTRLRHGRELAGMDTATVKPELTKEEDYERLVNEFIDSTSPEEFEAIEKGFKQLDETQEKLRRARQEEVSKPPPCERLLWTTDQFDEPSPLIGFSSLSSPGSCNLPSDSFPP
jgi:hypothetical protein